MGGRQLSCPRPALQGTRLSQILRSPLSQSVLPGCPGTARMEWVQRCPPACQSWPQRHSAPRWPPVLPLGASSHRACGRSSLQHRAWPHKRGEHVSRTQCIHRNKLHPMTIRVLPSPSMSCRFEANAFYLNTGGFNFPCLQLPLPLCSTGLRRSAPLAPCAQTSPLVC